MSDTCPACLDTGYVCEEHPGVPWGGFAATQCPCGAPGMPCMLCCTPVPQDGRHSIAENFVPDKMRRRH